MWTFFLLSAFVPCAFAFTCPIDETRGTVNATWGDPDVCRVYYHCVNDFPWPRQCPKDLHYDPTATGRDCTFRMCIPPEESSCIDSSNADEKYEMLLPLLEKYDTYEEPVIEDAEESEANDYYPCFRDSDGNWVDTTLPNRQNCKQYYHCDRGISWPSECPPTMYYTPEVDWLGPLEDSCEFTVCVPLERAKCAIDGAWGEWGAWSDCSAPCGDGLRQRRRLCDNPSTANGGNECPGRDIDLMFCNEGECKENLTAVFVHRITDLSTGQTETDPVDFEGIVINSDNSYDFDDATFTALDDGNYFMAINSGALALQEVNFYLKGAGVPPIGGRRTHVNHVGRDSISSSMILPMSNGDIVNLAAAASTSLSADAGKPTSWAVFNVNDLGSTTSTFAYAFNAPDANPSNPLKFPVNVSDENGGYDSSTGLFRPVLPGIYFLTMGIGVDSTSSDIAVDYTLSCSGTCGAGIVPSKITRSHYNYQGVDTLSRAVIVDLPEGAEVSLSSANPFWSSSALQTSFTGFLYQPDSAQNRVAFYVTRNSDWEDSLAMDPVTFNGVHVNQGNGWGAEVSNYYTVPVSGYYLITMSAGALPQKRVDVRLYQNDDYIFDIYRQSLAHQGFDTLSRTGIFNFQAGDRLRLRAIGNTGLHSTVEGYETSFGGMLLSATDASAENDQAAQEMLAKFKI